MNDLLSPALRLLLLASKLLRGPPATHARARCQCVFNAISNTCAERGSGVTEAERGSVIEAHQCSAHVRPHQTEAV
jgi:hypothetical protein